MGYITNVQIRLLDRNEFLFGNPLTREVLESRLRLAFALHDALAKLSVSTRSALVNHRRNAEPSNTALQEAFRQGLHAPMGMKAFRQQKTKTPTLASADPE